MRLTLTLTIPLPGGTTLIEAGRHPDFTMSIAYPIRKITIAKIFGFRSGEIGIGSQWLTGNVLFRAADSGSSTQQRLERWALGTDESGREYLLWHASHSKSKSIVIQPMDSRYCFEVSPT
jgi:hypothetical protein